MAELWSFAVNIQNTSKDKVKNNPLQVLQIIPNLLQRLQGVSIKNYLILS